MASRFDPTAFIAAEEKQALARPATVAAPCDVRPETADFRHSAAVPDAVLAPIATIAGPAHETTPWSPELSRFLSLPCPAWVPEEHWDELVGEADNVERKWGEIAHRAGWGVLDLYGCPPRPLERIYGQSGLVHSIVTLVSPVRLVAVDTEAATLQPFRGAPMKYRPPPRAGAIPLWDAYSTDAGP